MALHRPFLRRLPAANLVGRLAPVRTAKEFLEVDRKGGYSKPMTDEDRKWLRREYLRVIPGEVKRLRNYLRSVREVGFDYTQGTYRPFEDFSRTPDYAHPEWVVTVDADHGEGKSEATLKRTTTGTALFSGHLRTDVIRSDGQTRTGYASIRSPMNMVFGFNMGYHIEHFDCLLVRYRGDGRTYQVNLQPVGTFDIEWHDLLTYSLFTKGGPYWQTAKIPMSKLIFNYKGRIQDRQYRMSRKMSCMIISLVDGNPGPFRLELKSIGFYKGPPLNEKNAYEEYTTSSTYKVYW